MKSHTFDNSQDAWDFMVSSNQESEAIFSIPFRNPSIVFERTKEEYSPKETQKHDRAGEKNGKSLCWSDIPEYISPITRKPVDGRYARREEMKRHNVREVDPSENIGPYENKRFIEKHGIRQ